MRFALTSALHVMPRWRDSQILISAIVLLFLVICFFIAWRCTDLPKILAPRLRKACARCASACESSGLKTMGGDSNATTAVRTPPLL